MATDQFDWKHERLLPGRPAFWLGGGEAVSDHIRVLVVDDHRMFATSIELLLGTEEGIEVVGIAHSGEEALVLVGRESPDVVLMDINLPGMTGIEATRRLVEDAPGTKVLIVTAFQESELIAGAVSAGAVGFIPKIRDPEELLSAVRQAAAGEMILPSGNIRDVIARLQTGRETQAASHRLFDRLTSREMEVLRELAAGRSTAEVAAVLFISPQTVHEHVKSILAKLEVHSTLQAVLAAVRNGVVDV